MNEISWFPTSKGADLFKFTPNEWKDDDYRGYPEGEWIYVLYEWNRTGGEKSLPVIGWLMYENGQWWCHSDAHGTTEWNPEAFGGQVEIIAWRRA